MFIGIEQILFLLIKNYLHNLLNLSINLYFLILLSRLLILCSGGLLYWNFFYRAVFSIRFVRLGNYCWILFACPLALNGTLVMIILNLCNFGNLITGECCECFVCLKMPQCSKLRFLGYEATSLCFFLILIFILLVGTCQEIRKIMISSSNSLSNYYFDRSSWLRI